MSWLYPPMDMAQLFYVIPLVVLAHLHFVLVLSIPPLEASQVCSDGTETGLQVVLKTTNCFHQCVQMVPQDWYLVMCLLNMQQIERHNFQRT